MSDPHRLGRWLFENRDYTPIPLILYALIMARPTPLSAVAGFCLLLLGEAVRLYAVAFIGGVSRTRSTSLGHHLVTGGPFRHVRNPLYVGNFLITLGLATVSGQVAVILLAIVLFVGQYLPVVRYEESLLEAEFPTDFPRYRAETPAWIPARVPEWSEFECPRHWGAAWRSEKRTLTAIGGILVLLLMR